jgi:hypothetical protein
VFHMDLRTNSNYFFAQDLLTGLLRGRNGKSGGSGGSFHSVWTSALGRGDWSTRRSRRLVPSLESPNMIQIIFRLRRLNFHFQIWPFFFFTSGYNRQIHLKVGLFNFLFLYFNSHVFSKERFQFAVLYAYCRQYDRNHALRKMFLSCSQ